MSRKFLAIAVLLPLVVLAFGIVRSERHLRENRRWMFEVTGYDPRDLLRGHYIQYRLVLDEVAPAERRGESCEDGTDKECCLCLSADFLGGPTRVERTACETAFAECEGALRTRYLGELERYYIAEERADELTLLFQDASQERRAQLVVAVDKSGKPQVDTLLLDDMPIERAPARKVPTEVPPEGNGE